MSLVISGRIGQNRRRAPVVFRSLTRVKRCLREIDVKFLSQSLPIAFSFKNLRHNLSRCDLLIPSALSSLSSSVPFIDLPPSSPINSILDPFSLLLFRLTFLPLRATPNFVFAFFFVHMYIAQTLKNTGTHSLIAHVFAFHHIRFFSMWSNVWSWTSWAG